MKSSLDGDACPMPKGDYVDEYYNVLIRRYLLGDPWAVKRLQDVLQALRPRPGQRVLDIGCAFGAITIESAKRGAFAIGVDYALNALHKGSTLFNFLLAIDKKQFICADVAQLPISSCAFDKAVCADFLEHITPEQFKKLASEIARILSDKSTLVVYTPNPVNVVSDLRKLLNAKYADKVWLMLRRGRFVAATAKSLICAALYAWRFLNRILPCRDIKKIQDFLVVEANHFPVVPRERLREADERFEYLHVDLKNATSIRKIVQAEGFTCKEVRVTRAETVLQYLPFPLCTYWGGAITMVFEKNGVGSATRGS